MAIETVGYIGLGHAGFLMATNLHEPGFHMIVRDADPECEQRFLKENPNARIAGEEREAFRDARIIITMLPQWKVVRQVMLGETGYARGLRPGTIIVDTSSSSPLDTRSLGVEPKELGLILVDAPITQIRVHAIDSGDATIMLGSDSQEAVDKILPILRAMGKYIFHMGKLGSGHAMKTFNSYCSAAAIMATADSLVAGQKFGLDPIQMIDVLNVGTGSSFPTLNTFNDEALSRKYDSGFQLALLLKDIGITKEVFENVGFTTPLPAVVIEALSHSMSMLKPDADHTESLKGWEGRAGVTLKTGRAEGKTMMQ